MAPAAASPPVAPAPPNFHLTAAPFLKDVRASEPAANVLIQWEAVIAQFPDEAKERLGLAKLFENVGVKNEVILNEIARSPFTSLRRAHTNIVLKITSGAYAARCTMADSTNLQNHLLSSGVSILSQPTIITRGTNVALLQVSSSVTLVLGMSGKDNSGSAKTTNITLGPSVSVRLLSVGAGRIAIESSARLEGFNSYELAQRSTIVRPHLALTTMGTRAELSTNEALVLGGPVEMRVTETVDRLAHVSNLPMIGGFFKKTEVHTNFFRTLVILRPRIQ